MEWKYNGKTYESIPIKEEYVQYYPIDTLFYHKRWNKCYYMITMSHMGNGNQMKAQIEDIYTSKIHFCLFRDLELVVDKLSQRASITTEKQKHYNSYITIEVNSNKLLSNNQLVEIVGWLNTRIEGYHNDLPNIMKESNIELKIKPTI